MAGSTFDRGERTARRTAEAQLKLIAENLGALRKVDRTGRMERDIHEIARRVSAGSVITPKMYSYIESIYERTMEGLGLEPVGRKHDVRRKSLRFGR